MKIKIIFYICISFVFVISAYSQESLIIPDSIWESPKNVILYGKEQATIGNNAIIEYIEGDMRFQNLSIETKFNFYDLTQLGFLEREDFENAKRYKLKAIQIAKDNNREELNFSGNGKSFVRHNYYYVACYEIYKENLDSAVYYSLLYLSEIKKHYGFKSKEMLCALLSPICFSEAKDFVENLDFGNFDYKYNDSIKPKQVVGNFKTYHDAIQSINCALNEYQYSDSLLLAEIIWHKGDLLSDNGNIEEGLSLMYQSIALLSKLGVCLTDNFDGGLSKIFHVSNKLMLNYEDYLTLFLVNKFLLDEVKDKFDAETTASIKSNIVSGGIGLWLFDYADKYLSDLEESGGDERRITQNKYYRGRYYTELAKHTKSIDPLYKAIPYYEDIIKNSWHKNRMTTYDELSKIYQYIGVETGNFSKLEVLQEKKLNLEEEKIINRLCSSTPSQQYSSLNGMSYGYSVENTKMIEQFFEHMLFRWSIFTEFSKVVEKLSHKDKSLSRKWNIIKDAKNKNADSEEIDSLEHELMTNINVKKIKKYLHTDISKIRKQLNNDDLLIVLTEDDAGSIYAICLSKECPPQKISVSDIKIEDLLKQSSIDIANEISCHLCPHLTEYKHAYLLITHSLYHVPIENSIASNIKNINVHRIFSLRDIKTKEKKIKNMIAFGNPNYNNVCEISKDRGYFFSPLPGTAIEIDSISTIMNSLYDGVNVRSFVQNEATEENFKSLENSAINAIHFATHAFLGKQRIFDDSGLLLSGANIELNSDSLIKRFSNEGILRACEIENLHFKDLELVVLSACETGSGGSDINYGVLGLPLAFYKAGAKRMIVSLTKVDDDLTQAFMINFYKNLTSGKSIYSSFWEAMDNADEDTRNSFILIE